jgi:gas vesicle protein
MEKLIEKLKEEAQLTQEQAIKAISIMKDYMDKEGMDIDWEKFFKGKSEDFIVKARSLFSTVSKQTDNIVDKIDDFADKVKKGAQDLFNEK